MLHNRARGVRTRARALWLAGKSGGGALTQEARVALLQAAGN